MHVHVLALWNPGQIAVKYGAINRELMSMQMYITMDIHTTLHLH